MDVAGIEAGHDFRKVIDLHVAFCGVLLPMIGKVWTDATDKQGRRRLDDPMDFVRLEIASALKRDIPLIPVLVQRANMPSVEQLPMDLETFAYRNAVELTHARWDSDVQVLVKALSPYVYDTQPESVALHEMAQVSKSPDLVERKTNRTVKVTPLLSTRISRRAFVLAAMTLIIILVSGFILFKHYSGEAIIQAETELLAQDKAAAEEQAAETKIQLAKNEATAQTEEEQLAIAKAEMINVAQKEGKLPQLNEKSRYKPDKSDIEYYITRSSQSMVTS